MLRTLQTLQNMDEKGTLILMQLSLESLHTPLVAFSYLSLGGQE